MTAPNSPLLIRKATPHDIPLIRGIAHDTWPVAYGNILTPDSLNYMLDFFYSAAALEDQMRQGQQFFIAETFGEAAGFGSVSEYQPGIFKLNKLYVLPGMQKTGAGRALMNEAFSLARARGAKELLLNVNRNNPARGFYEKLGFMILRAEDVDLGNGVVQEDWVMGINL